MTSAKPEAVPASAVILADPTATPVTTPVALTVAIVLSEEDHSKVTPTNCAPVWSNATAVSCAVPPTGMLLCGALTATNETVVTLGPLVPPPHEKLAATISASRNAPGADRVGKCDRKLSPGICSRHEPVPRYCALLNANLRAQFTTRLRTRCKSRNIQYKMDLYIFSVVLGAAGRAFSSTSTRSKPGGRSCGALASPAATGSANLARATVE